MTFEEFVATLDPKSPFTEDFIRRMKGWKFASSSMLFARKSRDLVEIVQSFCAQGAHPIVDKKMKMVFGVGEGSHEFGRALLYDYHTSTSVRPDLAPEVLYNGATLYVTDGMGYYISSMRKGTIVVGNQYQPDRFDKDLFLIYKVDRTL